LDRSAAALGLSHHLHDLCEQGVGSHALGLHDEAARPVDRSSGNLGVDHLFNRDGLAADHRFIDRARALNHNAVSRDFFAGPNTELVAHLDSIQVHVLFRAVRSDAACCVRCKSEECLDCAAGLAAGFQLQNLPEEN